MSFLQKFTKRDLGFAVLTGLITGTITWLIFIYLNVPALYFGKMVAVNCKYPSFAPCFTYPFVFSWTYLVIVVPVLWILGVLLGYFLGKWLGFFNQFGKFAAIGFTNAAVDFGVLNLLIANTGILSGGWYPVFKGISFISAIIPSYFWNKYWVFSNQGDALKSSNGGFEFTKFMSVAIVSILINDGTASLIVNFVHPFGGLSPAIWANVGAVAGSAIALVFSFVGFKVAVFKK